MKKKYFIITYGCQMNKSDSEKIASVLEKMNFKLAKTKKEADLIVVNMCSVRQSAVDRIYGLLPIFKKLRNTNYKLQTTLTGCILKKDLKNFKKHFDFVFSIKSLPFWGNILNPAKLDKNQAKLGKKQNSFFYPDLRKSESCKKLGVSYLKTDSLFSNNFSGFIPISTGCNNFCSYCVVPFTRGTLICRDHKEILKEIKSLVKKGFKEFWLLGQNVNDYQSPTNSKIRFAQLLKMTNNISGNFWIRFTSPHPKNFSKDLISAMKNLKKVTNYVNLPVQSGDNQILKKMNRTYTVSEYKNLVKKIRKAVPDVCLSTDVIVGFPNETKKRFENTKKLFEKIKFDMAYIAEYSPRTQTTASSFEDTISKKEKKTRRKILTKILEKTALENNKKYIGKTIDVLVNESRIMNHESRILIGKTRSYKTVKFQVSSSKFQNLVGKFVKVKITNATSFGLKGKIPENKKMIVVLGPTSSGKTDLAVKLAKKFNGEIISADSRQVYKKMDIGTGKVTKKEAKDIPHYLLDVASPKKTFTVAQYKKLAQKAIEKIFKKNKIPILCGGTGFYIQAVIDNLIFPKVAPDWELRKKLEKKSAEQLYKILRKLDPRRAKKIDKHNKRRLVRAIEISKKTKAVIPALKKQSLGFPVLIIGIKKPQKQLNSLIEKRLQKRLKKGMIKEVKDLKKSGISWKRLESFGMEYRWVSKYLQKKVSYKQMLERLQKEIEHYSKRQITWFKKDKRIIWIKNQKQAEKLVKEFLEK